jgi:hypothetical protein
METLGKQRSWWRRGTLVNNFWGKSINSELMAGGGGLNLDLDIRGVLRDGCGHDAHILHLPDP